ncbi:Elongation factor P [Candidatus Rubidus massiliensis]|nr:MAG: elongation factor P [Chlamydia sp. 32-24]CDZ81221.1 Elongation factor P [Candidatus Rubidus massiliensis]
MVISNQIVPGMTLSVNGKLYRVDSSMKVNVAKGTPFIKTTLRDLATNELIEKSFKLNQTLKDVSLIERQLEFLYPEGNDYLFLDIGNLEQVLIPSSIIGTHVNYLKEGVDVKASFYGDTVFSVELPQFLELMVAKADHVETNLSNTSSTKVAILETGAKIEVPPFIEVGDIIKVHPSTNEFIQRV